MKDVATYSGWRMSFGALPSLLFALIGLGCGLIVLPRIVLGEINRYHGSYSQLICCLFPTGIGVLFGALGVRRLREAFEKDCWVRAGPEGVAWRLPGRGRWETLWTAYDMDVNRAAWKEIKELRLVRHTINGIPTGTDLAIVGTTGWRRTLARASFRESAEVIRLTIIDAAKSS